MSVCVCVLCVCVARSSPSFVWLACMRVSGNPEGNQRVPSTWSPPVGLYPCFRKPKRKTEGPQHFAFPEISRENRGCLVLHSGNSRVSLTPESESWSGAKSEAKPRNPAKLPGIFQVNPGFSGMPAKHRGFCRFGLFWAQTSLRLGSEPGKFDGFPGN